MQRWVISTLVLMLGCVAASACDCRYSMMDDDDVRGARHVFVVRVLATRVVDDRGDADNSAWTAAADVRVVETLRGDGSAFTSFKFSTAPCCGIRIDAGHYYFVALASDGTGPEFDGNAQTLVDFGPFGYQEPPRDPARRHYSYEHAREVEAGTRSLDRAFAPWLRDLLLQVPPPPPPPPEPRAPCPASSKS